MNEKKYVLQVQLTPKMHEENMQFYWHIDLVTEDGQFTVRHGWEEKLEWAMIRSHNVSKEFVI